MKEETLARAKELEEDIRDIRMAMTERSDARHFAMLEHYGYDARRNNLPKWLTPKIMKVLGEERERLEHELENLTDDNSKPTDFEPTGKYNIEPHDDEVSEQERTKKKRPKVLSMFYALLLCLFYVALAIGVNILSHKLFGLYCGIDSITFSMVFTIVWVLCYIHITED
jgi:hypothetical protein